MATYGLDPVGGHIATVRIYDDLSPPSQAG
jgi:hypothetical protein